MPYTKSRSHAGVWCIGALLLCGVAAWAQRAPHDGVERQLIGTWRYVSVDVVSPDGHRTPLYGADPQGLAVFDGMGNYVLITARADLPRFTAEDRTRGSAEENQAVVRGSIAHFGRYTVNEDERTITFHIHTSTFPNWNGADQKRPFTISADELRWRTPASNGSGTAEVVLRRSS